MSSYLNYKISKRDNVISQIIGFGEKVSTPHPSITEPGARRRAQLLSAISLAFAILLTSGFISSIGAQKALGSDSITFVMLITASIISYVLGRSKLFTLGSIILLTILSISGVALATANKDITVINTFFPLTFALGSALLSLLAMVVLIIGNSAGIILLLVLVPGINTTDVVINLGVYITLGVILLVVMASRNSIEKERLAELLAVNLELTNLSQSLEQRVNDRTRDLAMAAEISRGLSQLRDLNALLSLAVETIQKRFNLYYSQIYLVDLPRRILVLKAGTGDVGASLIHRNHRLLLDCSSINGTAVVDKRALIVADTLKSDIFRSNPLLPDTRSEMAIPLMLGERVVGVLDLQSSQSEALTVDNLPVFQALANQLAIAVENAELYTAEEEARQKLEAQASRLAQSRWNSYLDGIHVEETISYAYQNDSQNDDATQKNQPVNYLSNCIEHPIKVIDTKIGEIKIELSEGQTWSREDDETIRDVSALLSRQLENIRLLKQAERYRTEAEEATRRLTREGWEKYTNEMFADRIGYRYDQNLVIPITGTVDNNDVTTFSRDLIIQGETIGVLELCGVELSDENDMAIIEIIADHLSNHLENIRLFEQTQNSLLQVEKSQMSLQQSQQRLSEALDIAQMAYWEYEIPTQTFTLNDRIFGLLGTTIEQEKTYSISAIEFINRFIHPDDRRRIAKLIDSLTQSSEGNYEGMFECQTVSPNDHLINFADIRFRVTCDEDMKPVKVYGSYLIITDLKKAEVSLAKRAAELARVAELSTIVTGQQDPDVILQIAVDRVKESFNLYHAQIYLLDETGQHLFLTAGSGEAGKKLLAQGWQIALDSKKSIVAEAARLHQGVIVNDVNEDPNFLPNSLLPDTRSEMAIPLVVGNEVLGVLDVHSIEFDHFSNEDINIQTTLTAQIAVAMQNARQYLQTQIALSKTEALYSITRAATQSIDFTQVMQDMLLKTLEASKLDGGLISVVDETTDKLILVAHHNLPDVLVRELESSLDKTLCDLVYRRKSPITLEDMEAEAPLDVSGLLKLGLYSYQGIPLESKGKVVGTLSVFGFKPIKGLSHTLDLLQAVGQQIGISIENAKLFQQTQRRTEELSILNELARVLASVTNEEMIYEIIFQFTSKFMDTENFFVAIYDEKLQEIRFPVSVNNHQRISVANRTLKTGLTDHIIRSKEPLLITDNIPAHMERFGVEFLSLGDAKPALSWLGAPILYGTRVLGVIAVQSIKIPGLYQELHRDLLTAIASQAAIAIENARTFLQTQRQAEYEATVNAISQRIQNTTTVESALQVAIRELGRALGSRRALVQLNVAQVSNQKSNVPGNSD
jgi:GAF domain-containing protein